MSRLAAVATMFVVWLAPWHAEVRAQSPFGAAGRYNEFVFGNSYRSNIDSLGPVAVGGNAAFTNFGVNSMNNYGSPASTTALVVGGNLTATGGETAGTIYVGGNTNYTGPTITGSLYTQGSTQLNSYGTISGSAYHPAGSSYTNTGVTVGGGNAGTVASFTLPINFAALQANLTSLSSAQYSAADPTATTAYGAVSFTAAGTSASTYYFNVAGSTLASANTFNITAPSGSTVVINVSGTNVSIGNGGFNLSGVGDANVLWNFYQATSLTFSTLEGSALAPMAVTAFSNGHIDGNLIVSQLGTSSTPATGESHSTNQNTGEPTYFTGNIRPVGVPEPSSLIAMGVGLGAIGLARVVRTRRRGRAA